MFYLLAMRLAIYNTYCKWFAFYIMVNCNNFQFKITHFERIYQHNKQHKNLYILSIFIFLMLTVLYNMIINHFEKNNVSLETFSWSRSWDRRRQVFHLHSTPHFSLMTTHDEDDDKLLKILCCNSSRRIQLVIPINKLLLIVFNVSQPL